tara:strand:+ start:1906 stop:3699 length:1794 start_codon:yes stop_codon:yes gene_type:complete
MTYMPIHMKDNQAVSTVINHMGTGIPLEMALRELVVNGLDASSRGTESPELQAVTVIKDHTFKNKLAVVNVAGDYLSQQVIQENLATLGKSGNITKSGDVIMDKNKGIGAKIAYLPKARNGLLYRSAEKGELEGIYFQMCDVQDGIYGLKPFECEYLEEKTCFPITEEFSNLRKENQTIAEVVCMGDFDEEDTWLRFDRECGLRKGVGDGGTGYGIFRFLTHRLWDIPKTTIRVGIYEKSTGELSRYANVTGMKDFMFNRSSLYGAIKIPSSSLPEPLQGLGITAHWAVIKDSKDVGYSSNWSASGCTGIAWKGEVYRDTKQHPNSIRKDLNDCGVIYKANKVMVMFEIDSDCELNSNSGRTKLHINDTVIDKSLLHASFRDNFPHELREWQDTNILENEQPRDMKKDIIKAIKDMGFGSSKTHGKSSSGIKVCQQQTLFGTKEESTKKILSKNSKLAESRINSNSKLKSYVEPEITIIDDESQPLLEFHLREYTLIVNKGSDIFESRKKRILKRFEQEYNTPCVIESELVNQMLFMLAINSIYTIFDVSSNYKDLTMEQKREKWNSTILESNWNPACDKQLLRSLKRANDRIKKAA